MYCIVHPCYLWYKSLGKPDLAALPAKLSKAFIVCDSNIIGPIGPPSSLEPRQEAKAGWPLPNLISETYVGWCGGPLAVVLRHG